MAFSLSRAIESLRRPQLPAPRPDLPGLALNAHSFRTLLDAKNYRATVLKHIESAKKRITLVALYLQDDDAGREVMEALHAAHQRHAHMPIRVLVDWHRAQRGLIGKAKSPGNAAMYQQFFKKYGPGVSIYGVPVDERELFGVLHLKGFIFDDDVLYSGASLNDVYLAKHGRYRLDRYHLIHHRPLADCLDGYVSRVLEGHPALSALTNDDVPSVKQHKRPIRALKTALASSRYEFEPAARGAGQVGITPLVGLGAKNNSLNHTLLELVKAVKQSLVIYTPYFNLPRPLSRAVARLLKAGKQVTIVVGDKTANDFFIPPDEPFKTIGLLPYLYESNLRRFAKRHARDIREGRLNLHLWRHDNNSYHLKGLFIDDDIAVLTGNNLNPRSWSLDLENGLVVHDPEHLLRGQHAAERESIMKHAPRIDDPSTIETSRHYPRQVRQALRLLGGVRLDRLANRLL